MLDERSQKSSSDGGTKTSARFFPTHVVPTVCCLFTFDFHDVRKNAIKHRRMKALTIPVLMVALSPWHDLFPTDVVPKVRFLFHIVN